MSDCALIIFVKNPELGKVKTRLAKTVGAERALEIYRQLLAFTEQESARSQVDRIVYYSSYKDKKDIWQDAQKAKQIAGDLGAKISAAFEDQLGHYEKVCIIGTDCAELTSGMIKNAFKELNVHDVVLGPANDGGYYLLGMKVFIPQLFKGIEWSTPKVLAETIDKIKALNMTYKLLPELVDVDTIEDWEMVRENFK